MDQLAGQMRLAEGGATGHRGADGRRDQRVQKVHVQTDMQHALRRAHPVQKIAQRCRNAAFVQHPHVVHGDLRLQQGRMFRRIDRPDAEQADVLARQRCRKRREGIKVLAPRQIGDRRAMQVARNRGQRRVEIAVRIQPQQEQRPANARRVLCRPCNRTQGQTVVAAKHHRQFARRHRLADGGAQDAGPGQRLGQLVHRRVRTFRLRQDARHQIAAINDLMAQLGQRRGQSGHAIGGRAHQATPAPLAGIDRRSDQGNSGHRHLRSCIRVGCGCATDIVGNYRARPTFL